MTAAFGFSGSGTLRSDAFAIWRAGVDAVDSARLVREVVRADGRNVELCGHRIDLSGSGRICVVGGGKAGAGMARGLEEALGPELVSEKLSGWLNVPADCVASQRSIHLHAGRPAGVNEPTDAGVAGSERMLELVGGLTPDDLCVVLLSGGASALLPAPAAGISLADKQAVTRLLARAGADIRELNCVRKHLSRIKGGRLAQACRAETLVGLIISDIVGDPLDIIGSGPTVPDPSSDADALAVLRKYDPGLGQTPPAVIEHLERRSDAPPNRPAGPQVFNYVIGNNRVALEASAAEAQRRGYEVVGVDENVEGVAADVGRELARRCRELSGAARREPRPPGVNGYKQCILSGGEPVVRLTKTERPQKGGRNQELALAAVVECWSAGMAGICLLSGGTDGEDGPTDAAGAVADDAIIRDAKQRGLEPAAYLADHNSYAFFEQVGGLLKTGPTHTNVMDVRVGLVNGQWLMVDG